MKLEKEVGKNYYNIDMDYNIDNNILEKVKNQPLYDEKNEIWKVVLRKNPSEGYFITTLNKRKLEAISTENGQDKGHIIGRLFKKYLFTEDELEKACNMINNFFGQANSSNITPQSETANRAGGQLSIEQEIQNFIERSDNGEVYLEIEIIKLEEKILGRRILALSISSERLKKHVFIPEQSFI